MKKNKKFELRVVYSPFSCSEEPTVKEEEEFWRSNISATNNIETLKVRVINEEE